MTELTSFQSAYNEARIAFNLKKKKRFTTSSNMAPIDTSTISVKTLATVALMLVHNLKKKAKNNPSGLTINTLEGYNLNTFRDQEMFEPYIDYLLKKRFTDSNKVNSPSSRASYTAMFIRYLFIAQIRGVRLLDED